MHHSEKEYNNYSRSEAIWSVYSIAVYTSWGFESLICHVFQPCIWWIRDVISLNNNINCMLNPIHMMQKSILSGECCGLIGNVLLYTHKILTQIGIVHFLCYSYRRHSSIRQITCHHFYRWKILFCSPVVYNDETINYIQRGKENKNLNVLGDVLSACTFKLITIWAVKMFLYKNLFS